MERGYRTATRAIGLVTAVLGVCILALTLAHGGGPLAIGSLVGVGFVVLGAGRLYLASRSGGRP